jgi:predicted transcriptional regulator
MENETLIRSLVGLGLTDKEAAVYITALSLESATAYRIAEISKLKRPTVYVLLEELRRKGLVLKTPHPKKALFSARPMTEYLAEEESRLAQVQSLLPRFEALRKKPGTAVYFYSGISGMRDALGYKFKTMCGKKYLSFYGDLDGMSRELQTIYDNWDKEAIASGIKFRVIRARGKEQNTSHLTTIEKLSVEERYVEANSYPSNISFEIADDFIRITDAKELFATIIESRETADALRLAFEIIWNMAKEA